MKCKCGKPSVGILVNDLCHYCADCLQEEIKRINEEAKKEVFGRLEAS